MSGQVGLWQYLANLTADKFASSAAADFQIDPNIVDRITMLYDRATRVRRRLIEVHCIRAGLGPTGITCSLSGAENDPDSMSIARSS